MKNLIGLTMSLILLVACTQDKTQQSINNPPPPTQTNTTNVSDQTKTDQGKHIGTEYGGQGAGYGQVKKKQFSAQEMKAIMDEIRATIPAPSNTRFEDGWIKFEIIMDYVPHKWYMERVREIVASHGGKVVEYKAENVVWECVGCTGHSGTSCIKIEKI